jgi:hypothetical protein
MESWRAGAKFATYDAVSPEVIANGMIVSVQASWRGHAARGVFKAVKSAMSSGVSWTALLVVALLN